MLFGVGGGPVQEVWLVHEQQNRTNSDVRQRSYRDHQCPQRLAYCECGAQGRPTAHESMKLSRVLSLIHSSLQFSKKIQTGIEGLLCGTVYRTIYTN